MTRKWIGETAASEEDCGICNSPVGVNDSRAALRARAEATKAMPSLAAYEALVADLLTALDVAAAALTVEEWESRP